MVGFCHRSPVCFCYVIGMQLSCNSWPLTVNVPFSLMNCLYYIKWWASNVVHFHSIVIHKASVSHFSSFFFVKPEDSKRPVTFQNRGNMGEELDSLRATIDDRHGDHHADTTNTNPRAPRRRKRFLSYPRYVELMVTADAKMVRHHGRNLEHYILTIMSVVSKIMFLKITT